MWSTTQWVKIEKKQVGAWSIPTLRSPKDEESENETLKTSELRGEVLEVLRDQVKKYFKKNCPQLRSLLLTGGVRLRLRLDQIWQR